MKSIRPIVLLLVSLFLCTCSTVSNSSVPADLVDSFNVRLATLQETENSGTIRPSPYIPPDGLFLKSDQEFIVLVIEAVSESGDSQASLIDIVASDGSTRYRTKNEFISWWKTRSVYESYRRDWQRFLDRTYVPEGVFSIERGKSTFIAVMMGKRPIPKPLSVEARFMVNGQEQKFLILITE